MGAEGVAGAGRWPARSARADSGAHRDDGRARRHLARRGELWHVRGFADAPPGQPLRPLLLTLARPHDLHALCAAADRALETGEIELPARATIAGLAPLAGEDPAPWLRVLHVGADGLVRAAPGAAPLGELGEHPRELLATAQRRVAAHDAIVSEIGGGWPVPSLALDDEHAVAVVAERPHLRRFALLLRALRALERPGEPRPDPAQVRVAGLGGRLSYDGPSDPRRPLRRLVLRVGERHAIYDIGRDRALAVGSDLAAIVEGLDATGDPATVSGWLAAARGISTDAAGRAVGSTVARLHAGGMLDPAELEPLPAPRPRPRHAQEQVLAASGAR